MSQMKLAVKCQFCKNRTKDSSGRCHDHRNINSAAVQQMAFGTGLVPKTASMQSGEGLYLLAKELQDDLRNGNVYELDITDGYGEEFDEIVAVSEAERPNDGMLAFSTKGGTTIFFLPNEYVDVRLSALAA